MSNQPTSPDPSPEDVFSASFKEIDAGSIREIWAKALARRIDDPPNAITLARSLLETVCKIILDSSGAKYAPGLPLPKLYELTARALAGC